MAANTPQLEITCSRQFPEWMAEQRVSLALTTYQTGKLFMIGLQASGRLSIFERTFNRCMGLYGDGQTLWMSTLYQLWRLENVVPAGQVVSGGYDRVFVPQVGYTTGDVDIHDITVTSEGQIVFANTLFNCIATLSETHSFAPVWMPKFISKLAAEDRCHLNGVALDHGKPRYVTTVSQSDIVDGWRDRRRDGGCVIDIASNELVATGLSMPHSPRVHRDQLWLLNSGSGYFGRIDRSSGNFEPLTFCAGYLRGLAFIEDFAVAGLSRPRENKTFTGLELDENLAQRDAETRCGLQVIDLRTMDVAHWLRIEGIVAELYDVVVMPNVMRPMLLGFKSDEIRRTLSIDDSKSL